MREPKNPEDRVLTPAEAAAVLGIAVKDLHALAAGGKLKAHVCTLGGHRRYLEDDVLALRTELDLAGAAPKETLNSREAGEMLGVAPKTVTQWVRRKKIKGTWNEKHHLHQRVRPPRSSGSCGKAAGHEHRG